MATPAHILSKTLNINCNNRYYSLAISGNPYNYPQGPGGGPNLGTFGANAIDCWVNNIFDRRYILRRVWENFLSFDPRWFQNGEPLGLTRQNNHSPIIVNCAVAQNPNGVITAVPFGTNPNITQNIIWEVEWGNFPGAPRPPGYPQQITICDNKYPRLFRVKINMNSITGNSNHNLKNSFLELRKFLPNYGGASFPHKWVQIEWSPAISGFYLNYLVNLKITSPQNNTPRCLPFRLFHCSLHFDTELPIPMNERVQPNNISGLWHFKSDSTEWENGLFPYNIIDSQYNSVAPALPQYPAGNFVSGNTPQRGVPIINAWARHAQEGEPNRIDSDQNWYLPFIFDNANGDENTSNFINYNTIMNNLIYTSPNLLHTGSESTRPGITPDNNYQQVIAVPRNGYCQFENSNTRRDLKYKIGIHNNSQLKIVDYRLFESRLQPPDPDELTSWDECTENSNNHRDILNENNPNEIAPNNIMRFSHIMSVLELEYNRINEVINEWIHDRNNFYNPTRINRNLNRIFYNSQPITNGCIYNSCVNQVVAPGRGGPGRGGPGRGGPGRGGPGRGGPVPAPPPAPARAPAPPAPPANPYAKVYNPRNKKGGKYSKKINNKSKKNHRKTQKKNKKTRRK